MKPGFQWTGEAEQACGTATWTMADGKTVVQPFGTFAEAHELNTVVEAAYRAGQRAGRDGLALNIEQALAQAGVRRPVAPPH